MGLFFDLRPLIITEILMARCVFASTIPYSRVHIANNLGLKDRPWTQTSFGSENSNDYGYIIHLGKSGYLNASSYENMPGFGLISVCL